jgi:hypothetical protein
MSRKETIGLFVAGIIFAIVLAGVLLLKLIDTAQAIQITISFVLVLITAIYVKRTADRQGSEAYAAIHEETSHGLSCTLCNIGVGPAIDVRCFIQHPERGRLPWEKFGTLKSGEETERIILSISDKSNHIALVASYEDIYGRTLKSSREVSIDKENHNWKLGRLNVVTIKEGDNQ